MSTKAGGDKLRGLKRSKADKKPAAVPSSTPVVGVPADFPIVGIGASAGGLAAFEAFFAGMPADTDPDMAFVLVQHLAPDHKSILSDLIRRYTRMQVFEVTDGMVVQPNCAYIIPPGRDMAFLNGALTLLEPAAPRGQRLPIDFFFRSLAQDQYERAIGIVLSGTGSDGTQGVRAIKGARGMVMAQTPESTAFDGMPRSAIATGLVDYELPPAEMPAQLITYAVRAFGKRSPPAVVQTPTTASALKKIFILLRAQIGHDFSHYKPTTIHRRIERRMAVHRIDTMDAYVKYLQQTPAEVEALFRDCLIGVTRFFRDTQAFQALDAQIIPALFADQAAGAVIRVWSAGCSTGEEAYSIAILLQEHMEALGQSFTIQVFATDIDDVAISTARAGLYPVSIAADVSAARLARFFTLEPGGSAYRIHQVIRDMLVFSEQNAIRDPPFSKLDLISCRNLLIYFNAKLQQKLISLFHYALNPGGILFLGTSEGVGEFADRFVVLNQKAKLYRCHDDGHAPRRAAVGRFLSLIPAADTARPPVGAGKRRANLSLREMTEQALLRQIAPSGALVNGQGDILYLHGRTGVFLEPAPGEAGISNILKMARAGLRRALTTSLRNAAQTNEIVRAPGLRVKTNGHTTTVNLCIRPASADAATTLEAPLYLVVLEEALPTDPEQPQHAGAGSPEAGTAGVEALKQELRAKEAALQSATEELESSGEELKSANEEMQSVNEELQSTNEELETSKEELQSVNEELATVNTELHTKVEDLSRSNNDMNNLLAGTGIGTVFVDHHLRILRFTPAASEIMNLILSDVGRPVSHVLSNIVGYDRLIEDTQAVLDTLLPKEVEVQIGKGRWFVMRILPYRTLNNVIEGAVITFVDVTEIVKTRGALSRTTELLERTGEMANVGGWSLDLQTNKLSWALQTFRIHEIEPPVEPTLDEALNLFGPVARPIMEAALQAAIDTGTPYNLELQKFTSRGRSIWLQTQGFCEMQDGKAVRIYGAVQDITERKHVEEALRKANEVLRLAVVVRDSRDAITMQDLEGHTLAWNPAAVRMYGWSEAEALAMNVRERIPEALKSDELARIRQLSRSVILESYRTQRIGQSGAVMEVWMTATALVDEVGTMYAIATTERADASTGDRPTKV